MHIVLLSLHLSSASIAISLPLSFSPGSPHILLLPLSSQGQACCICKVHNTFPHPSTAQSPPSSLISGKHNERDVNKLNEGLTRCWCLSLPQRLVTPRQAATENKVPGTRCSVSFLFLFLFAYSFFHLEFR